MRLRRFSRASLATIAAAISIAAWMSAAPSTTQAAVFAKGDTPRCTFKLTGKIVAGDADKLRMLDPPEGSSLCLDSPGGDFQEAMKMAILLESYVVATAVQSNASCYGACALAFMGGSFGEDDANYPRRNLHLGGKLGFNTPGLAAPDKTYSSRDINETYASALTFVSQMLDSSGQGGQEDFFSRDSLLKVLAARADKPYMIDDTIKANEFNINLIGAPKATWTTQALCNACVVRNKRHAAANACEAPVASKTIGVDVTQMTFHGFGDGAYAYCSTRLSSKTGEASIAPTQYEASSAKDDDFVPLFDEDALPVSLHDD